MRALVVYESMYGNTRRLAEAITRGMGRVIPAQRANVNHVRAGDLEGVDLLVVGGPTHAHGMSRAATRTAAVAGASAALPLDADARGTGVREWAAGVETAATRFAAFGSRMDKPKWITGSAAAQLGHLLQGRGLTAVMPAEDFLVDGATRLPESEIERAEAWGAELAQSASAVSLEHTD